MIGLCLCSGLIVLNAALPTCGEAEAAVAVAIALARVNRTAVESAAIGPTAASAAAKRADTRPQPPAPRAETPRGEGTSWCDEDGCRLSTRSAPQRRVFGKRR
jgi:hypothetical protein